MRLNDLIGLNRLKELAIDHIAMSRRMHTPFPHLLLHGRGGLGKTETAMALAEEADQHPVKVKAAPVRNPAAVVELMDYGTAESARVGKPLFLILDEVHQSPETVQEAFYDLMTRWEIELKGGLGVKRYPPFTLCAATTDIDRLDANSFVARFPLVWALEPYSTEDMIRIAWMASQRDPAIKMTGEGLRALADASHGIPRTVVNLVAYLKAHMAARGLVIGNSPTVRVVLAKYEIDENGLTLPHRRYLEVLQEYDAATKQPCPLNWFVAKLSSNEGTVREIEQELIRMGLIAKAPRGRVLTAKGRAYRLEISHGV